MAGPLYTTDLLDLSVMDATTGTTAIGGGGARGVETDFFIQGNACISKLTAATWDSAGTPIGGVLFDNGSGVTIPSPGGFFAWIYWWGPGVLDTFNNGGARLTIGSALTAFNEWNVKGVDDWIFGGWEAAVVDPAAFSPDRTVGSPTGTRQFFGWEANVLAAASIGKGAPYGLDVMRYGRGELRCTEGSVGDGHATITGAAAWDNDNTRRWGLMTPQNGAYFMHGLFVMGTAATAVSFNDSNRVVFVRNTRRVASNMNGFEVRNASSVVVWTNISVQALGTVSRGFFLVTAGTLTLDTCTFTDMDTFTFLASTSALNCTFRRCNAVTATGSDLRGSGFRTPTVAADASGLVWTDTTETDGLLDNATFSMGTNAHHAISFASTTTDVDYTLRNIDFSGFNATPASNDSAIYVAATTGTITIYLIGCSGNITAKSAGATVTFISDPVTVTVTTKDVNGDPVGSANVLLKAASGGSGILPVNATIDTITWSGGTATATHAAVHNMSTGDQVHIKGANQAEYNGVFTITFVNTTQYTYATSDPGGSATGTITGTFVFLKGTTHATTGILSMSRVIAADQNVIGWARKSTASPFYKTASISGTVSATVGLTATAVLILDE